MLDAQTLRVFLMLFCSLVRLLNGFDGSQIDEQGYHCVLLDMVLRDLEGIFRTA